MKGPRFYNYVPSNYNNLDTVYLLMYSVCIFRKFRTIYRCSHFEGPAKHIGMTVTWCIPCISTAVLCTHPLQTGSTLNSEGSFVRRFCIPKPFEVAMVRRTYGPKVLYSEVPLLRKLCSEDSIFRKAFHYMDSMLRRFFSPKFIWSEGFYVTNFHI